jgi:ribosomal protein L37E
VSKGELPVFDANSKDFECPKCGFRSSRVSYCKGDVRVKNVSRSEDNRSGQEKIYGCPEEHEGEHLHQSCARCGHIQLRRTRDHNSDDRNIGGRTPGGSSSNGVETAGPM